MEISKIVDSNGNRLNILTKVTEKDLENGILIIPEGIDNGEFYEGDVEALASGIFGVTCSSLIYRLKKNKDVDVEKVYKGFINTVIKGISKE